MIVHDLISVIVPIYNTASYLPRALSSLEDQTYANLEILLINDGSTDNSEQICMEFANRDPRFKYTYQPNGGVSKARNNGLAQATGQYITFMDSDDWVDADYIECMYSLLLEYNADISIISFYERNYNTCNNDATIFSSHDAIIELYKGASFDASSCGKLYKKELFERIRFLETIAIAEDKLVTAETLCLAKRIVFQALRKYHYEQNCSSATRATWNPNTWTCVTAAKCLYDIIAIHYPDDILYGCAAGSYTNLFIAQKLSDCGRLDKDSYRRIKSNILQYYTPLMKKVASRWLMLELRFFLHSRRLYIFARKIIKSKLYRALKFIFHRLVTHNETN